MPLTTEQLEALKKITSPSVANAIEVFKVRPRQEGNVSSEIRGLFPELGPLVGYAATCLIRAEQGPIDGHRASLYGWWDFVMSIPAPRVIVVHDLDEPRGQGAQWGEVQANIHRALGCVGVVTDGSVRDLDEVRALKFQFAAAHVSVSHANIHMVDFGDLAGFPAPLRRLLSGWLALFHVTPRNDLLRQIEQGLRQQGKLRLLPGRYAFAFSAGEM